MKLITKILITSLIILVGYNVFLVVFPLNKTVFYTNEERIEEFLFGKDRPIVLVGSSLSGAFEDRKLMEENYFNLYLPHTGALTGLEVLKRSGQIPKILFVEINHIDRGIDSSAIKKMFSFPMYELRTYLPFLRTKNKVINNMVDRVIKPSGKQTNDQRPPENLYNELLKKAVILWGDIKDSSNMKYELNLASTIIESLSVKGCKIVLYEMPIDSALKDLPRAKLQREYFLKLASDKGYKFIDNQPNVSFNTGDGVHLLSKDAANYMDYFVNQLKFSK